MRDSSAIKTHYKQNDHEKWLHIQVMIMVFQNLPQHFNFRLQEFSTLTCIKHGSISIVSLQKLAMLSFRIIRPKGIFKKEPRKNTILDIRASNKPCICVWRSFKFNNSWTSRWESYLSIYKFTCRFILSIAHSISIYSHRCLGIRFRHISL